MARRQWRCRACRYFNQNATARSCVNCGKRRPPLRKPSHAKALDVPYETYVERFGERCGICGAGPSPSRRLDRDHWHNGPNAGEPRGLLCHVCNRALTTRLTPSWLRAAAAYLERERPELRTEAA